MNHGSPDLYIAPELKRRLCGVRRVFVLTGAGVSVESGIPAFRGTGGIWGEWNPEDYATPEAFERDPVRVWQWYLGRIENIRRAEPNPAHRALAELERRLGPGAMLTATQNVDGLHRRAGSGAVAEIHGEIFKCRPVGPGFMGERPIDEIDIDMDGLPPRDAEGSVLRPAVVWFGEYLPPGPIKTIEEFLSIPPDLVVIAGTTAGFPYVQDWATRPKREGAILIEVNPDMTLVTPHADAAFQCPAGEALPRIFSHIEV